MPADVETCFREHRARVYRWALALCRQHAEALDVVQEVFMRLLSAAPALSTMAETLAWLRRTTTRLVIDRWRADTARRRRESAFGGRAGQAACSQRTLNSAAGRLIALEERDRLLAALAALSEQQRLVLIGKFFDGLSDQQVADELGITRGTVSRYCLRGLEALAWRLSGRQQRQESEVPV